MRRFLSRIVAQDMEEAPPRTPQEADYLKHPRTVEARALLVFAERVLPNLPIDDGFRELVGPVRLMLESTALECEQTGDVVLREKRLAQVRATIAGLREVLASIEAPSTS